MSKGYQRVTATKWANYLEISQFWPANKKLGLRLKPSRIGPFLLNYCVEFCGFSVDGTHKKGVTISRNPLKMMERVRRFERPTSTLARLRSTPELHPHFRLRLPLAPEFGK